jgi:uncharacterized membrane protein YccC
MADEDGEVGMSLAAVGIVILSSQWLRRAMVTVATVAACITLVAVSMVSIDILSAIVIRSLNDSGA